MSRKIFRYPPVEPDKLWTVKQVAELWQASEKTVYRRMDNSELAYVKIGRLRRITSQALDDYIARQTRDGPKQ